MTPETAGRVFSLKRASLLFGSQEIILRASGIGLSLFAARALGPGELGRLGLAVIVSGLVSMVASCAESAAIYLDRTHGLIGPAGAASRMRWSITVFLVAPILVWTEPLVVLLSGQPDVVIVHLVRLMLIVPCLEALATAARVSAQRALDLSFLGRIQLGGTLAYFLLAFLALASGFGVIGMIAAQISAAAGTAALLWTQARGRWRAPPSEPVAVLGWALHRGAWRLFVGGFGGFLGARLDNLLVASSLGPVGLGLYTIAWSASRLCMMVGARAVDATMGPILPQIGVESAEAMLLLRRVHLHFTLAVTAFSSALMVWTPLVVPFVLGNKWLAAVPAVQLMSLSVLASPTFIIGGLLLNTSGQGHFTAFSTAAHLTTLAILIPPLASQFGVVGGALGDIAAVAVATTCLLVVIRSRGISTAWIDRRATLWALVGLVPCAAGTRFLQPAGGSWTGKASVASACTAAFLVLVSQNDQCKEIMVKLTLGGWAILNERRGRQPSHER